MSRGCQAPRGTRVCPGNWRVTGTRPLVCGRASTAGQNFAPTVASPTVPTVWATGYPTQNLFTTENSAPSAPGANTMCPLGFVISGNNCRGPLGTTTCPGGSTAATTWRQIDPATSKSGVTCAAGIKAGPVPPVSVPAGPMSDIAFTTVISGISVVQFNSLGGVSSYIVALSIVLQLPPSMITVSVVSQRRALQAGTGSVSLSVVVTVPTSRKADATTTLATSSAPMTQLLHNRGGSFAAVSAQSATLPGAPTFRPTAKPSFSPVPTRLPTQPSPLPTVVRTAVPSIRPSTVPTLFPTITLSPPTMSPTSPAGVLSSGKAGGAAKGGLSTAALAGIGGGAAIVVLAALYLFLRGSSEKKDDYPHGGEYMDEVYGRRSHESNNNFTPHVGGQRGSQGRRSGGSFSGTSPVHDKGTRLSISKNPSRASIGNRGSIGSAYDLGRSDASVRSSLGGGPSPYRAKVGPPPGQVRLSFSKHAAHEYTL